MPTISPSSVLQLFLLHSSKQKASSFMHKLGHLISSETWISFRLKSTGRRSAPLQRHLDAKILRLKSFSLFPCAPSSLSPASQLVWRELPAYLLDPNQKLSWGLAFTICPGGSFATRYNPTCPICIHQIQDYVSLALGMNRCTLLIWKAHLRQPLHDPPDMCPLCVPGTFTVAIALAGHCSCLYEVLRGLPIPVPTAEYFRGTHRKNTFSVSTTCIFNSLS